MMLMMMKGTRMNEYPFYTFDEYSNIQNKPILLGLLYVCNGTIQTLWFLNLLIRDI